MKRALPLIVAILAGVFVLIALIYPVSLGGHLNLVLTWSIVVGTMGVLVAIAYLFVAQWRQLIRGKRGSLYSFVFVSVFLFSLAGGLVLGVDHAGYREWIAGIQKPLELSLMGLLALVLTRSVVQFFHARGWNLLTLSFGISALLFLVVSLGFLQSLDNPQLVIVLNTVQRLPIIGARGLLLGLGIGALVLGLRVLTGQKKPWGNG